MVTAAEGSEQQAGSGWMPSWLKSRLPGTQDPNKALTRLSVAHHVYILSRHLTSCFLQRRLEAPKGLLLKSLIWIVSCSGCCTIARLIWHNIWCCLVATDVICILALLEYASTLRQARRMGSVANMIPGVGRASATESLHLYESIIK